MPRRVSNSRCPAPVVVIGASVSSVQYYLTISYAPDVRWSFPLIPLYGVPSPPQVELRTPARV